jgi:hypothetical protein
VTQLAIGRALIGAPDLVLLQEVPVWAGALLREQFAGPRRLLRHPIPL